MVHAPPRTRTRRRHLRVWIVAVVAVLSSCSALELPSAGVEIPPASVPISDSAASNDPLGGPADAVVTFEQYESAVNAVVECMQAAGAPITEPVLNGSSGLLELDFDPANDTTFDECDDNLTAIEARYLDGAEGAQLVATGPAGDWSSAAPDSWVRVLASIPETTNTRYAPITIIDLERATALFGIDRPSDASSDKAAFDYLADLAAQAGIVPSGPLAAFGRSAFPDQMRSELGFDQRDFDRLGSAGVSAREVVVGVGNFDSGEIADAVATDVFWSDELRTTTYKSASLHEWGIDFDLNLNRFSPTRSVGHNRRLVVDDDLIGWTRWTEGVEGVIDAVRGDTRSLADVDDLVSLAAIGDEAQLYTGVIIASVSAFVADLSDQRGAENLLRRPDSVLIGDGSDDNGRFTLIALRYDNASTAETEFETFTNRMTSMAQRTMDGETVVDLDEPRPIETTLAGSSMIAKIWLTNNAILDPADAPLPHAEVLLSFS